MVLLEIAFVSVTHHKNQNQPPEVFHKKDVFKNFAKFKGKHLCQRLFFRKETAAQVFSCEFSEIFKNTFFIEHLRWLLLKNFAVIIVFACQS